MCVTLAAWVKQPSNIEHMKTCLPAETLATVNKVKLQRHTAPNGKGIDDITVEDPAEIRGLESPNSVLLFFNLLRMSGYWRSLF